MSSLPLHCEHVKSFGVNFIMCPNPITARSKSLAVNVDCNCRFVNVFALAVTKPVNGRFEAQ